MVQKFPNPPIQYDSNGLMQSQQAPNGTWYACRNISTPGTNDVLCGRGGGTNNWVGNLKYRKFVDMEQLNYTSASKSQKIIYSNNVVQRIRCLHPPGRFLNKNAQGTYDDIGDQKAREKTSQCLREGQPSLKKELNRRDIKPSASSSGSGGMGRNTRKVQDQQFYHESSSQGGQGGQQDNYNYSNYSTNNYSANNNQSRALKIDVNNSNFSNNSNNYLPAPPNNDNGNEQSFAHLPRPPLSPTSTDRLMRAYTNYVDTEEFASNAGIMGYSQNDVGRMLDEGAGGGMPGLSRTTSGNSMMGDGGISERYFVDSPVHQLGRSNTLTGLGLTQDFTDVEATIPLTLSNDRMESIDNIEQQRRRDNGGKPSNYLSKASATRNVSSGLDDPLNYLKGQQSVSYGMGRHQSQNWNNLGNIDSPRLQLNSQDSTFNEFAPRNPDNNPSNGSGNTGNDGSGSNAPIYNPKVAAIQKMSGSMMFHRAISGGGLADGEDGGMDYDSDDSGAELNAPQVF